MFVFGTVLHFYNYIGIGIVVVGFILFNYLKWRELPKPIENTLDLDPPIIASFELFQVSESDDFARITEIKEK